MPKTPRSLPTAPRTTEILTFPGVQLLDMAGPLQVFATCNDRYTAAGSAPPYAPRVIACDATSIVTSSGLALSAEPLPKPDTDVIVAGGNGVPAASRDRQLIEWLQARAVRARRVASVCTGAFMLAEAGLLDGRRAAIHWANGAELAGRYPKVRVEADPIFVRDGAVWTSPASPPASTLPLPWSRRTSAARSRSTSHDGS